MMFGCSSVRWLTISRSTFLSICGTVMCQELNACTLTFRRAALQLIRTQVRLLGSKRMSYSQVSS